ncbi:2-octaprenylphenol hydroxylase COQ7/UbiB [Zymomonas mobilis subsp. mobilis ZM4 = ATCC 31821]|uniref:3-demethoxyubiquinol 3-hydroxylase n=2 Tax=Zymomonas mobilis subsp. mobilis TaxID=120045 RepID=Q5NLW7_ZYMMO|nr:demethoxyubiquinone hydroxylase family protein [Zymomonas mobilis]AAV90293.1 Ubiquinone biosynthesis protein COQ7 [Zymomonas mobilis subsp. mobilis ZM4 = ATCC 31821]ACV76087.1 Ubiquinone biosynthesis protein COQ7 [Zymomonas mobilis subsp. mobilis NCIMB 11163]AEH63290.1 Ubiquinone biosynthesis protein COQ7 [Zymomonas mobilis subsp. mobilis ATCC 10988]AHB10773.1 ubiquinone biosynthesis protein COQ7 [Zymomonas mobilis subsp. mobilis str. CP4 = NRRL B-14023]AHJ71085.1 2-nonaprenyl-3-methyl-6-me
MSELSSQTPLETKISEEERKSMIRVDHAGEYGAIRIYAGQLAIMGDRNGRLSKMITRMAAQEDRHFAGFEKLVQERHVRPTLLQPVWKIAGFALGAATALIGPKTAMACTAAVESEIDEHYKSQMEKLGSEDHELKKMIAEYREEELEHRDHAIKEGAEEIPAYPVLYGLIRLGCRAAIELSKRF